MMRRCVFVTIQLHLSHTLVEGEIKFLNGAWQLQATTRCRLLGQRKIADLLSSHPNGNTQLLNLGTVPFIHTKRRGVFKSTNISIGISSLCDLTVLCFSHMNGVLF